MKKQWIGGLFLVLPLFSIAQPTILQADGPGNTYELITSVLAPGYNPIETPDCTHPSFGRHIEEIWDTELQAYVFNFHIHVNEDDDRCINFDRQRNEIKTYASSPDHLKGVMGETVVYKWKFKLDSLFQPSSKFTHIHQIKAVDGTQSDMPLITLAPRAGSLEKLQLLYSDSISQNEIASIPLADVKGVWVSATETITYNEVGNYEITLRRMSDNAILLQYQSNSLRMWRTGADHIRPKWGIYRSLVSASQLRDEQVRFNDFSIEELNFPISTNAAEKVSFDVFPNPAQDFITLKMPENKIGAMVQLIDMQQKIVEEWTPTSAISQISVSNYPAGSYFIRIGTEMGRLIIVK